MNNTESDLRVMVEVHESKIKVQLKKNVTSSMPCHPTNWRMPDSFLIRVRVEFSILKILKKGNSMGNL